MFLSWLGEQGFPLAIAHTFDICLKMLAVVTLCWVANAIAKKYIVVGLRFIIQRTENKWDDLLFEKKVFIKLSHLAPALVLYFLADIPFASYPQWVDVFRRFSIVYMICVGTMVIESIFNVILDIYQQFEISRTKPIKGYVQAVKIIVYIFAIIFIVSTLINKSPLGILSLLGGLTAVIILVFKDTLLGFVASIQLVSNNMIARGDWIEMPKYGADGDVIDITLNTVKVKNWDKTITTIPTYALISDSFKNWRGMSESGGRRIKRSIYIDMNSVKFLEGSLLEKLRKIECLQDYLKHKEQELKEYNKEHHLESSLLNGRRLTNVGTFRAYLEYYLHRHPKIHQNMTFLVRHLQPTQNGLPIQIYVFSNDQKWANFESIQADILDHILAVIPEFDLRVFQNPSGLDFQKINPSQ